MIEKPLISKFDHYEIQGAALIKTWDGNVGGIKMEERFTKDDLNDHKNCIPFINDGGFGCQQILSAVVEVFKVYEHGAKTFWYNEDFNLTDPGKKLTDETAQLLNEIIMEA